MFLSSPLLKENALAKARCLYPKVTVFSEILPLALKNSCKPKRARALASSCTQELQALFGCLKKWEFDDKPCAKQHSAYMDCVHESERIAKQYQEAATMGTLGDVHGKSLTTAQFNNLMKLFPQPDLGQRPYRHMKRLPTQSYAEDIFHRKHLKGKAS
uniref:CHCH domain-containing protein n=1 Tax=Angiostrongylus cantonensis TaxID=6313 RepID=A0A0K0DN52_ANGCA